MTSQKTLYILRHAKAEPLTSGQDDHDRSLAERGVKDARSIGKYLVNEHIWPQRVLCSSSVRTRQTLQAVQEAFPQTLAVHYEEKLYLSSAGEMLAVLAAMPEDVSSVLLVGHNPGLHELCLRLVKEGGNLRQQMMMKFPTGAFVEMQAETTWAELGKINASLIRFVTPENI